VTQDDLALRITELRPGETPFLQPLGTDPESASVLDEDLQPIALGAHPNLSSASPRPRPIAAVYDLTTDSKTPVCGQQRGGSCDLIDSGSCKADGEGGFWAASPRCGQKLPLSPAANFPEADFGPTSV
jgi:hypothetical protein